MINRHSFPARDSADALAKAKAKTRMLTHEQWKLLCMLWPQRDENRRWLINAPSGSGKTFVAVRLACEFVLHPRLLGMQAQAGAVLLCSHSRRLQQKTVEEVNEYLAEMDHQVEVVDMAEQQYVTTITSKTTGVRLVVKGCSLWLGGMCAETR